MRVRDLRLTLPLAILAGLSLGCQKGSSPDNSQPQVTAFTAQPAQVAFGQSTTLAWNVDGDPKNLLLSDDLSGNPAQDVTGLRELAVNPVRRQTFTLDAGPGQDPARLTLAVKGLDLVAGHPGSTGNLDGPGAQARFFLPGAVTPDGQGGLYVADTDNHSIRRISAAGVVTTVAGKAGESGADDGPAAQARFNLPEGLVLDAAGNLLIADTWNQTIRRLSPDGMVSTVAGAAGDEQTLDGAGGAARFAAPCALARDPAGVLYIAESQGNCIRRMTADGVVTTLAGRAGYSGFRNGTGAEAEFNGPVALAVDAAGNLIVADSRNQLIRRVTPAGQVTTLAGLPEEAGSEDGPLATATFGRPSGVAVDAAGAIYVSDADNCTLRRISPQGQVATVAGAASERGQSDGPGAAARFSEPLGLAADAGGNLFVADSGNASIRRLDRAGLVTTVAGSGFRQGFGDGRGAAATFGLITAAAVDGQGNTYLADQSFAVIRKVTPAGVVSTVAGRVGEPGSADGPAAQAQFTFVSAMAVAADGTLYLADAAGPSIRKLSADGMVSTLAGSVDGDYLSGLVDGQGAAAQFMNPSGLALDAAGNLYVADLTAVRRVTPAGLVTTIAGTADAGHLDGTGAAARFQGLAGLACDAQGTLYLSEGLGNCIRRVTAGGVATTLAGDPDQDAGFADGTGVEARFKLPAGLAVDAQGSLYVADYGNGLVRKVSPAGAVTTVAGQFGQRGIGPGPLPGTLAGPSALAFTPAGDLMLALDHCLLQVTRPD
jgi:sugar lactone lactonase YvrE